MVKTKRILMLSVVVAIVFTLFNLVSGWTVSDPGYDLEYARSDRGVLPEFVEGNTPHEVEGFTVFKQDYGSDGFQLNGEPDPVLFTLYPDPMDMDKIVRVWLAYNEDGKTYVYRWETEGIAVHYFMVKGGENFLIYSYDGTWDYDGGLISPRVGVNDQNVADISHIDLVFTLPPTETTPEETTAETTPEESTTVTEAETTAETTPEESTTVTEAETTAETTPEESTTVTEGETVTELTEPTNPLVEPTTVATTIEDDEVPQTGESGSAMTIGLVLIGLAGSLLFILRRVKKANL